MSDIQEEQKRLYKRAEENDIKLLQEENKRLNNIINKAIKRIEKELSYTPSSTRKEVGLILVDYKKLLNILKGDNK